MVQDDISRHSLGLLRTTFGGCSGILYTYVLPRDLSLKCLSHYPNHSVVERLMGISCITTEELGAMA